MTQKLLLLFLAGGAGTLARYGLDGLVQRLSGATSFPWGIAAVNLLGCFLFGLVGAMAAERGLISAEARLILLVGFMGAFTTFSTLIGETGGFLGDGQWFYAAANFGLQSAGGLILYFLGLAAGRAL
ncbi:MAG: CrcB family protein [Planctomycetota bacterium]|nr:CrcB family protein [Planctomycetota bacterium]